MADYPCNSFPFLPNTQLKWWWQNRKDITHKDKEWPRRQSRRGMFSHLWEPEAWWTLQGGAISALLPTAQGCWEAQGFGQQTHWGPVCLEASGIKGRAKQGSREKGCGWKSGNRSQLPSANPFPHSQVTSFLTPHRASCSTHTGFILWRNQAWEAENSGMPSIAKVPNEAWGQQK